MMRKRKQESLDKRLLKMYSDAYTKDDDEEETSKIRQKKIIKELSIV